MKPKTSRSLSRRFRSPRVTVASSDQSRWLLVAAVFAVVLIAAWLVYDAGRSAAGYDSSQAREEQSRLEARIEELEAIEADLRHTGARLERSAQIDSQATRIVREQIRDAQDNLLQVQEELSFYRSIVSPDDDQRGLRIQSLRIRPEPGVERGFGYRLVLIQVLGKHRVTGSVRVTVEGLQGGTSARYPLKQLDAAVDNPPKLRFKAFQSIEGVMVLPEGFQPHTIMVEAKRTGKAATQVSRSFDWPVIMQAIGNTPG